MRAPHLRRSLALLTTTALVSAFWPATTSTAASNGKRELWLRFNGSSSHLDLRNSGISALDVRISSAGGSITPAAGRGKGYSARMPRYSSDSPATPAVITALPTSGDPLSPGTRAFVFGAHFHLDAASQGSSTDNGNNLIQRGLYAGPQYKIQVDGRRVSCRVAGNGGDVFVRATNTVDPRYWHRAVCTRNGDKVTLAVTRYRSGEATTWRWSRRGAIGGLHHRTSTRLSIGGKVDAQGDVIAHDSDQFNGRIDNAFFRLL